MPELGRAGAGQGVSAPARSSCARGSSAEVSARCQSRRSSTSAEARTSTVSPAPRVTSPSPSVAIRRSAVGSGSTRAQAHLPRVHHLGDLLHAVPGQRRRRIGVGVPSAPRGPRRAWRSRAPGVVARSRRSCPRGPASTQARPRGAASVRRAGRGRVAVPRGRSPRAAVARRGTASKAGLPTRQRVRGPLVDCRRGGRRGRAPSSPGTTPPGRPGPLPRGPPRSDRCGDAAGATSRGPCPTVVGVS